jgi:hypothetical protein
MPMVVLSGKQAIGLHWQTGFSDAMTKTKWLPRNPRQPFCGVLDA